MSLGTEGHEERTSHRSSKYHLVKLLVHILGGVSRGGVCIAMVIGVVAVLAVLLLVCAVPSSASCCAVFSACVGHTITWTGPDCLQVGETGKDQQTLMGPS